MRQDEAEDRRTGAFGSEPSFEVLAGGQESPHGGAVLCATLGEAIRIAGSRLGLDVEAGPYWQRGAPPAPGAEAVQQIDAGAADMPRPAAAGLEAVEIICRRADLPRRRFWPARRLCYIDPLGGVETGDGSELQPFSSIAATIACLEAEQQAGRWHLRPRDRLRIVRREVFTPTRHERRKQRRETIARWITLAMTMALVAPILCLLTYLVYRAWPVLSPSFILENPRDNMTAGGIWAPLVGTFFLVVVSLLISAPIGVLAGIYLNEYARDNWLTRLINLAVVNLAGVPSIVHALFGVGAFVLAARMGRSVLAASCTLAVMSLPVIITSTREALNSVPMAFREACWNLGATRWQTIRTMVLPNSISGILTGVILQVARAAGETAPILFTGAVYYAWVADKGWESFVPYGLFDRCMALSMHLFTLCTQAQGVSEEIQYGTAVVLIALVLVVNSASIGLRMYLRSRKRW